MDQDEADEIASNYDIETPQYKEKQTLLPHPLSELEKKHHTPVKRSHDGKIKIKSEKKSDKLAESAMKYQESSSIDMRKLERHSGSLTSIINNSDLLEKVIAAKTPRKNKKKDKDRDKSSEKKKKSKIADKQKPLPTINRSMQYGTVNLNTVGLSQISDSSTYSSPSSTIADSKEESVKINLIDSLNEDNHRNGLMSSPMDVDDIPFVVEEEVVIESLPNTATEPSSSALEISIQSAPHYSEEAEVITEQHVPFSTCSQTASSSTVSL